MKRNTKGRKY